MYLAVRKASKARLLDDMRRAAKLVAWIQQNSMRDEAWNSAYVVGAMACSSLTQRACLLTAFGG